MVFQIKKPSKNRKDEESSKANKKELKRFEKFLTEDPKKLTSIIIVIVIVSVIWYRDIIYSVISQYFLLILTVSLLVALVIMAITGIIAIKKVIEGFEKTEKIYENLKEVENIKNINELLGKAVEQLKQIVDKLMNNLPTNERIRKMEENITNILENLGNNIKGIPTDAKIKEIVDKLMNNLPTNERIRKMEENITNILENLGKTLSNQCSNIVSATYDIALGEILPLYVDSVYEDAKKAFRNSLNSIGQKLLLKSICDDIVSRPRHQNIYIIDKIALLAQLEYCEDNHYISIDKKFKENYEKSIKNELRSIVDRALDEKKINLQKLVNNICGGSE